MRKKNKWTLIPFVVTAALVLTGLYFIALYKGKPASDPLKAVPLNASIVLKMNDLRAMTTKMAIHNALWNELQGIPGIHRIARQLAFLDSLCRQNAEVADIINHPPSYISAHVTGNDRISFLHAIQIPPRTSQKKVHDLIASMVKNHGTIQTRKYEGVNISEVVLLKQETLSNFSFAICNHILLIGFSAILIEDAIRQLHAGESLDKLPEFQTIFNTAGKNVYANLFINFSHFPKMMSAWAANESKSEVRSIKNFAGWAGLDMNLLSDTWLLNGFITPPDSQSSLTGILLRQEPQKMTAPGILPGSVASFFSVGVSDAARYFRDYKAFLRDQGTLSHYENTLASLNNTYGTRLPNDLIDMIDNEFGMAYVPSGKNQDAAIPYFFMRIKSKALAEARLKELLTSIAASQRLPLTSYEFSYKLDNEVSFVIFKIPIRKFCAKIFGSAFEALDEQYCTLFENYLIFSTSVNSVQSLIHGAILNKTLQNDPAYISFQNNLSTRSNLTFYCDLSRGHAVFGPFLRESIGKDWEHYQSVMQKVRISGFQMYAEKQMLHTNVVLQHLDDFTGETQTVWESKLDTLVDFKPVFVRNHKTRQNEVFVQDLNHTIYLVNQVGRILWKIKLPEPINSEVFQVDFFRNGKLQLLFSTRSALYMIDRNGNFVGRYPVQLRSPATCGLSVFDYENNRNYRLFIACEDKSVYAYSGDGSLLQGWAFGKTEKSVNQPIEHFRVGEKDFIIFGDGFRTYILDRKGHSRLEVESYFQRSVQNSYHLHIRANGSESGVVTTDTAGIIYYLGFNGKTTKLKPPAAYTNNHYFDFRDLNGDGISEYIFAEGNTLNVYNADLTHRFTRNFEATISRPLFYEFSATDRKLGFSCRKRNQIFLINANGETDAGFPLQGHTAFSIGNFGDTLSRFNLVVGSRNKFLYNYRVK